jgi:hypothetical protein
MQWEKTGKGKGYVNGKEGKGNLKSKEKEWGKVMVKVVEEGKQKGNEGDREWERKGKEDI